MDIAFAVAGLIAGFKGAVDGYVLLTNIFASDNGIRFAALRFHIEKAKLDVWGERFQVNDEANCLLKKESEITRKNIGLILAEIEATQEKAAKFIKKYAIEVVDIQKASQIDQSFSKGSKWVGELRKLRQDQQQKKKVAWAVKDKDKFVKLINHLDTLNRNLWEVVRQERVDDVRIVTAILAGISNQMTLATLQQQTGSPPSSLLSLTMRLKELQDVVPGDAAKQVTEFKSSELQIDSSLTDTDGRFFGYFTPGGGIPSPIWVEWKTIEANHPAQHDLILRIKALGTLLSAPKAVEFRRPTCLGIFNDKGFEEHFNGRIRIGLIYSLPQTSTTVPKSLIELLKTAKREHTRPALGQRFELAYRIASAMSLLHASNWLHKSFRSENVLFATGDNIVEPWITGFQYSRPDADTSLESYPFGASETSIYNHPDIKTGWSKVKDIYSLGIVLLEIAYWRPMWERRFEGMDMLQVSQCIMDDLSGRVGEDLIGLVGKTYVDAAMACLKGFFGGLRNGSMVDAKLLSTSFFLQVVKPLESCKA